MEKRINRTRKCSECPYYFEQYTLNGTYVASCYKGYFKNCIENYSFKNRIYKGCKLGANNG